jgi:energy-coupling factor transporter ATP-binding protein EcfA2
MKKLLIVMPIILFLCAVAGVQAYVPESRLEQGFQSIFTTFEISVKAILVALVVGSLLALLMGAGWLISIIRASVVIWWSVADSRQSKAALIKAEAAGAWRDANLILTVTPPGHGLYASEVAGSNMALIHKPVHLSPGYVNGVMSAPEDWQIDNWRMHQLAHATAKRQPDPAQPGQPPLTLAVGGPGPVLPALAGKDCIMVVGNRGSGKTNLMKHLVFLKRGTHAIILIDPHTPSKICGFDTIGAGGDWTTIESTLLSLEQLGRYRLKHPGEHQPIFLFVDEWRSVVRKVDVASEVLLTIVHEFRKAQIDLAIASQGVSVKALGIQGEGELRDSFTIVECEGYEGQDHKVYITPRRLKNRQGQRLDPVEYLPPPPFSGEVISPKEIYRLPPPKTSEQLRAEELRAEGKSYTFIAREIFGVSRASGPQIEEVRRILGEV